MANINTYLQRIMSAIYGREVRNSIHDAIEAINNEVVDAHQEMDSFVQGNMDTTLTSTVLPAQAKAVGDAIANYQVHVDTTLTQQGEAADAKATGDAIKDVVIVDDTQPSNKPFNQIWIDEEAEDEYTVPTYAEFTSTTGALEDNITGLQNAITLIDIATSGDIGKALSPKTITNGHVSEWQFKPISGGGGGTSDYSDLDNKPQINSVTLAGNKSLADLGIAPANSVNDLTIKENLLTSDIPGTTQTVVFDSNGNPTSITHTANNTTVRTDTFVWGTGTVTETRTMSNKYITLTTNLTTLETVISEILEVA